MMAKIGEPHKLHPRGWRALTILRGSLRLYVCGLKAISASSGDFFTLAKPNGRRVSNTRPLCAIPLYHRVLVVIVTALGSWLR